MAIEDRVAVFDLMENATRKRNRRVNVLLVFEKNTGEQCHKLAHNCSRKECKQFIEAKKRDFRSSQVNSQLSTVNDSEAFWKEIRNSVVEKSCHK